MLEVDFFIKMRLDCCTKLSYIKIDKSKTFKNFANIMNQVFVQFDINDITAVDDDFYNEVDSVLCMSISV